MRYDLCVCVGLFAKRGPLLCAKDYMKSCTNRQKGFRPFVGVAIGEFDLVIIL